MNRSFLRLGLVALAALPVAAYADDVKVGGTLELNYTYNFNKPSTATNGAPGAPYYFNAKDSQFSLNYGELHVYRDPSKMQPVGFSFRLVDGEVVAGLPLNSPGINSSTKLFYEAYGRVLTEYAGKSITWDAGVFPTHVGYETIPVGTNSFFSKSFHFGQFQPFYNMGIRASVPVSEKTTVMGLLFNRYNGIDTNGKRDPGFGFQVAQMLSPKANLFLNGAFAKDTIQSAERQKNIVNVVYTNTLSDSLSIALDASSVSGKKAGNANFTASGATLYGVFTMGNGNAIGLRAESLTENSAGGLLLPSASEGKKPTLSSVTASYEIKGMAKSGLRTLFEVRFDSANTAVFPTDTGAKKSSTTFTLAQIFNF